jgi:thiol-disulfide isomerase/thioredoxin
VAVAITVSAVGLVSCSGGGDTHDPYLSPGKRTAAPALKGTDLGGKRVDIATSRGRTTVINFWASWCAPCRAESDGLRAVAQTSPDVAFLGVDEDHDNRPAAVTFARAHRLPYPSAWDNESTIATDWVVSGLPQTFVVDASGKVAARFFGPVTESELTEMLHRVAADRTS